jgi:hypothetical protein
MTAETMIFGAFLVVNVVDVGVGLYRWRSGGKRLALSSAMGVALYVSVLTVGWVRYVAWAFLARFSAIEGRRFFTERNPSALWSGLVFLPMIFGIALTEVLVDELSLIPKVVFSAVAVLAAAAIVTVIVRLFQARRALHG